MKVLFALLIAFIIAFSIFYIILTYPISKYDFFNTWADSFHSKKLDSEQKNIFIIGSSQVGYLNTTYIDDLLLKNGKQYHVYNLALTADTPYERLTIMEKTISLKPEVIVYGIGFRDFENTQRNIDNPNNFLPDPANFFKSIISPIENLFGHLFDESPRVVTQDFLTYFLSPQRVNMNSDRPFYTVLPSNPHSIIKNQTELKREFESSISFNGIVKNDDKQVVAFNEIINELQQNKIKIILFTVPQNKIYLDKISESDKDNFNSILENTYKNFDIKIYSLQEKYDDLNIWQDPMHVAANSKAFIYEEDVAKMILNVTK